MWKKHKTQNTVLERHTSLKGRTKKENDRERFTLSFMVERENLEGQSGLCHHQTIVPSTNVVSVFFTEGKHTPFLFKYCFCCLKD